MLTFLVYRASDLVVPELETNSAKCEKLREFRAELIRKINIGYDKPRFEYKVVLAARIPRDSLFTEELTGHKPPYTAEAIAESPTRLGVLIFDPNGSVARKYGYKEILPCHVTIPGSGTIETAEVRIVEASELPENDRISTLHVPETEILGFVGLKRFKDRREVSEVSGDKEKFVPDVSENSESDPKFPNCSASASASVSGELTIFTTLPSPGFRGMSTIMIKLITQIAKTIGCSALYATIIKEHQLIPYYEKLGFSTIDEWEAIVSREVEVHFDPDLDTAARDSERISQLPKVGLVSAETNGLEELWATGNFHLTRMKLDLE